MYGLRNQIPCTLVPVFDQFGVMLKTGSIEQQSTLGIEEHTYPVQPLEIGKTTL